MEEGWERVRGLIPAMAVLPPETFEIFHAIYSMGWMDGSLQGMADGIHMILDELLPAQRKAEEVETTN